MTSDLNLKAVCERYQSLQYLEGVVELSLSAAKKNDPQNLALHYYKSGQPTDDSMGHKAFYDRYMAYSTCQSGDVARVSHVI